MLSEPGKAVSLQQARNRNAREEAFQEIIGSFLAAGVLLAESRIYTARGDWDGIPELEFPLAIALARDKALKNEPRFMGMPDTFIRKAEWRARGPGRILPEPMGKREIAHEIASKNFRAQRGEA